MASGVVKKDKEVQIAIILNCAGPQIIDIYDQFICDEEGDEKKPDKLFEKLEGYCNPRKMKYWSPIDFGTCNTKNHSITS